jgi:hypothetical protein
LTVSERLGYGAGDKGVEMLRVIRFIVVALGLSVMTAWGAAAEEREACLESCRQTVIDCEQRRCGTAVPATDTECARVCGDRYRECKQRCPS